jgi:deoxyribodipyrimidine photolyase
MTNDEQDEVLVAAIRAALQQGLLSHSEAQAVLVFLIEERQQRAARLAWCASRLGRLAVQLEAEQKPPGWVHLPPAEQWRQWANYIAAEHNPVS